MCLLWDSAKVYVTYIRYIGLLFLQLLFKRNDWTLSLCSERTSNSTSRVSLPASRLETSNCLGITILDYNIMQTLEQEIDIILLVMRLMQVLIFPSPYLHNVKNKQTFKWACGCHFKSNLGIKLVTISIGFSVLNFYFFKCRIVKTSKFSLNPRTTFLFFRKNNFHNKFK